MKAAVFHQIGKPLVIETIADPEPEQGEVIIKVKACGICGSDLHATSEEGMLVPNGTVLGHEFVGEIIKVGPSVPEGWAKGDRICTMSFWGCGKCIACLNGVPWQCQSKKIVGLGEVPGGYAEIARIHVNDAVKLPESVAWQEGALVEPLSVGLHGVRLASSVEGKNVLVVGAGPIGLAVVLWCKFMGARHIIISDFDKSRGEMAVKFGATGTINPKDDIDARFLHMTGGSPELIFECVGVPGMIAQCIDRAPYGAEIIVLGFCSAPDTLIPAYAVVKEVTLKFSIAFSKADLQFAVEMLAAGRVNAKEMITQVVSFKDLPEVFENLKKPSNQCKVILDPEL